ncbi:MFS transporter [Pseudomonas abieticivorans]|uniref:MFS transporter n=1 Tax=Pseudomonas abieticivorans TaxID=2931382 RepID=UPI0020C10552|nr:MFS transporter [Pseudomonas sp. PIA16]
MPFVIYACALCAFALGLSEFVVIGLAPVMSADFSASAAQVGQTVTLYALGVTLGGAFLTALSAGLSRKHLLVGTLSVFAIAHVAMYLAPTLQVVSFARLIAGMTHGVFLAVAASTAAQLVDSRKSGGAVAMVFSGLTIALVAGVPLGAYLGVQVGWRLVLLAVAVAALIGVALLARSVPYDKPSGQSVSLAAWLKVVTHRALLGVVGVTVLTYTAVFTVYTYIAAFLTQVTGMADAWVSIALLVFGAAAIAGNLLGGALRDRIGSISASLCVALVLIATLLALTGLSHSALAMTVIVAALGIVAFAAVSVFQSRIIEVAQAVAPQSGDIASGLNIAGFNLGIVLGSLGGGWVIDHLGLSYLGIVAALISAVALAVLLVQRASAARSAPLENA